MDVSSKPRAVAGASVVAIVVLVLAGTAPAIEAAGSQSQPETDNTVTRIEVNADGSATWTIRIRTRLDTDERVAEYEAFQEAFRANTSRYLEPFRQRMTGVVANAANATGRDMQARNFAASTSIQEVPRRWGVVTYEFTWTRFARGTDEGFVVGDVFEGGFFLTEDDTLEIAAVGGLDVRNVEPAPDARADGVLTWQGREDFADGRPRVELVRNASTPTGDANGSGLDPAAGLLLVVLGALAVAGVYYGRRYRRGDGAEGGAGRPGEGPDRPPAPGRGSEAAGPDRDAGAAKGSAGGDVATAGESSADDTVMTDEERVMALLESRDGRLRQAAIAEELDWSASKTSRTIGAMAEEGTVEKLRLGRENLVELADGEEES